jgi:hypothetical protein
MLPRCPYSAIPQFAQIQLARVHFQRDARSDKPHKPPRNLIYILPINRPSFLAISRPHNLPDFPAAIQLM